MTFTLSESNQRIRLTAQHLDKQFVLHGQGGISMKIVEDLSFQLNAGECTILAGASGIGKSTILKILFGNYRFGNGSVLLHFDDGEVLDLSTLPAHQWPQIRRDVIGYVSQFLRVVPRVPAVDIVMEPLLRRGEEEVSARQQAETLLARLNLPERLWSLAPSTFSGGEQQRVNIARGFIAPSPILLLDEPTASLDAANCNVVIALINEAKKRGSAMLGVFHDEHVRDQVADHLLPLESTGTTSALQHFH